MSKKKRKQGQKSSQALVIRSKYWGFEWFILLGLALGTFLLRTVGQYDKIFVNGAVLFRDTDPWYHMRLADNVVVNFPHLLLFDQYLAYPNGSPTGFYPVLSWFVGLTGRLGMDYEKVGAFLPPVLGAFSVVLVYFLGKKLFGRSIGFFAAVLAMVLPGEFFHRTLLGHTDHHALEVFLMLLTLTFLVHFLEDKGRLRFAILAGAALGLYTLSWHGNLFFLFILITWFIIQFLYNYYKKKPVVMLCKGVAIMFIIPAVVLTPYLIALRTASTIYLLFSYGTALVPVVFFLMTKYIKNREAFLLILIGLVAGLVSLSSVFYPSLPHTVIDAFRTVFIGINSPIAEVASSTPQVIVASYGVAFLGFLGGLFFLIWKRGSLLVIVWSLFLLAAAIGQRKWGYYFTLNVALLASYFVFEISKTVKPSVKWVTVFLLCLFCIIPSIRGTIGMTTLPNNITLSWYSSLVWLEENSPSQFESDVYYGLNVREAPSYGVLCWWDYGHWITRISHRVPTSNPAGWGTKGTFYFYPAQSIEEAEGWIKDLNIRYVFVDDSMLGGKFPTIAQVGGKTGDMEQLWQNSMIYKLYYEQVEGYKLIHSEGGVKIFEKESWPN